MKKLHSPIGYHPPLKSQVFRIFLCCAMISCANVLLPNIIADDKSAVDENFYSKTILPLFRDRCWKCHGDDVQKGELNLSIREGVLKGGESGAVIVAGKPEESPLYEAIRDHYMPPENEGERPLTDQQVEFVRRWIAAGASFGTAGDSATITQHDVIPILWLRCTVCHGTHVQEGGLDLRTKASMLKGGNSGPAIVPGQPEESLLIKKIRSEEMPPRRKVVDVSIKPIEPDETDTIIAWIAAGALESDIPPDIATTDPDPLVSDEDRDFWSFQPPQLPTVPSVVHTDRVRNPIDAFVLAKLEAKGMTLAPEADRQVLMRRLFFDLTGLPPTPEETSQFMEDDSPNAYEKLVNRLLDSPHYGERWGRYWLDLAGYSDSYGVQHADVVRKNAWRYRDYVIRAFNDDKPYNRFLTEQIAGDELADYEHAPVITPEIYDNLVATGFLRMTPDGSTANITNFVPDRLDIISDELNVLSSAVMGLTLKCARCHTHKSDPIPHRDYYRLSAIFKGAFDEHDWLKATKETDARGPWGERKLKFVTTEEQNEWEANEKRIAEESAKLRESLASKESEYNKKQLETKLATLPEPLRDDLRKMLTTPDEQRDDIQKYLATKFEAELKFNTDELKKLEPEFQKLADEIDRQVKALNDQRRPEPYIFALWDRGEPSPTYIYKRGDYKKFGREVGPGVLSVLTDGKTPFVVTPPWPDAKQTGRRLAFARWLTEPNHPLTARVMVNRIWRHHFGAGIVRSLDNFGKTGDLPTHPELLDWLARMFIDNGWSIKEMHRLMVTSSAYRQSSRLTEEMEQQDPENMLLSRMPMRRNEAEIIRDSLLAVAGRLDVTPFGPPDAVDSHPSGLVVSQGTDLGWRRTVYILQRRTQTLTMLEDFDLPQMLPNCVDRPISTVAPQALHLMNNQFVHKLAERFAARVKDIAGTETPAQIEVAWKLAFARKPTIEENQIATTALKELSDQWLSQLSVDEKKSTDAAAEAAEKALVNLCHALFNSAEFITID
ncbi:MAG: DUF1553 domain-containing protein [Planctomycetota bacterium]|nr:DUF1553 domain-containing protein [Planctomycetota bacterium]MDA1213114.1 DUF1553 domain-containing protein [Planctomycetota bacterium]